MQITAEMTKGVNWVCAHCGEEHIGSYSHTFPMEHGSISHNWACERCDRDTSGRAVLAANEWTVIVDPSWEVPAEGLHPLVR